MSIRFGLLVGFAVGAGLLILSRLWPALSREKRAGLVLTALLAGGAISAPSLQARTSVADATRKPWPRTARAAIALVRASQTTNEEATPFKREIAWTAEWRGDRWWVLGLFESPWSARFVVDASIIRHKVYAYIDYVARPSPKWVKATARRRWHLRRFYTRLPNAQAIQFAKDSLGLDGSQSFTVLDAAAKLARDTARSTAWYFVFYVQTPDNQKLVYAVTGFGSAPAQEGQYVNGYGFGSQPQLHETVPLNLTDWVRSVAQARGWQPSNL